MAEIIIRYENLEGTPSLDKKVLDRMKRLEKFLHKDSVITVTLKDLTPNKKTASEEYEVIIETSNIESGKHYDYNVTQKHNQMYDCVDKAAEVMKNQLSKNHDKRVSSRFAKVRVLVIDQYDKYFRKNK